MSDPPYAFWRKQLSNAIWTLCHDSSCSTCPPRQHFLNWSFFQSICQLTYLVIQHRFLPLRSFDLHLMAHWVPGIFSASWFKSSHFAVGQLLVILIVNKRNFPPLAPIWSNCSGPIAFVLFPFVLPHFGPGMDHAFHWSPASNGQTLSFGKGKMVSGRKEKQSIAKHSKKSPQVRWEPLILTICNTALHRCLRGVKINYSSESEIEDGQIPVKFQNALPVSNYLKLFIGINERENSATEFSQSFSHPH